MEAVVVPPSRLGLAMSRPVSINVPHSLGKEGARRQIAFGFTNLSKQLTGGVLGMISMQERWEGDRLHFEGGALGQRITGRIDILADSIAIQVDLPDFLVGMADQLIGNLKTQAQKLLAKRP